MKEKANDKKYYNEFISVIPIIIAFIIVFTHINTEVNQVAQESNLITEQSLLENDFTTKGFTLENPNVILNPYGISPLTALVLFETRDEVEVKSTVVGDNGANIIIDNPKTTQHYIPIYGLYPDRDNKVFLETGDNKVEINIKTKPLPLNLPLPEDIINANVTSDITELYWVTPASEGYTSAYDKNGDVRWYLTEKLVWDISKLKNGNLLLSTERPINPPYYTTGLYEIDFLGKIYNEFSLPGGYHHDFFELENGNLLVASDDFDNEAGTVEDIIVELDRKTGDILKTWDLKEILNMEDGKSENWSNYDWFHNNSVWYDKDSNNIILSGRHQDAVIAINYSTSKLSWIIGDPTNWSQDYQAYFFTPINNDEFEWQWSQHAAMVTPEGYIFILDNGNNKSKIKEEYIPAENSYTRGVMYDINLDNMTIEQVWQYGKERGSEFYSPYISDVDYINKNHYIIHSGGIVYNDGKISNQPAGFYDSPELYSKTVEILNDEVVFELTLPGNFYRAEKMTFDNNFKLGKASCLGSLGRTKYDYVTEDKINSIEIDDFYKSRKIELTQDKDRLIMNGTFLKGEDVEVILRRNKSSYHYKTRVSKKPYTALCLNVFSEIETENMLEINKYINNDGLKGKYYIYIKIGDKVYSTNQFAVF